MEVRSDAGLLACRGLDGVFGLTEMVGSSKDEYDFLGFRTAC